MLGAKMDNGPFEASAGHFLGVQTQGVFRTEVHDLISSSV
jgi:hypothetical protein